MTSGNFRTSVEIAICKKKLHSNLRKGIIYKELEFWQWGMD